MSRGGSGGGSSPNRASTGPVADEQSAAAGGEAGDRDLPLDAHLHTDQSPDSSVPIDIYAALAVERGIPEIAITDNVDFDPRDRPSSTALRRSERVVAARPSDGPGGRGLRFGAELTYNRRWEADVRDHLARPTVRLRDRSVHDWPNRRTGRPDPGLDPGRSLDEIVAPYYAEIIAAARSGLFDTIGQLDVVKRYLHPHVRRCHGERQDILEPALHAIIEGGWRSK